MTERNSQNEEKLLKAVIKLNAKLLGLVLGILFGLAIFIATNWLVIKGLYFSDGEQIIGPHLQLLDHFFIGYRVSFLGSIIGFFYGFAVGTFSGALIGTIYNKIVHLRKAGASF